MPDQEAPESGAAAEIAARDEILQVMYWLHGEGLAGAVTAQGLARWLGCDPGAAASRLELLAGRGWVEPVVGAGGPERSYRLTAAGLREGGRRFADEFADLTRQAHGACDDADCACHATGDPADCRQGRV